MPFVITPPPAPNSKLRYNISMRKYWIYYLLAIQDAFVYRGSMFIYRLGNLIELGVIAAVWLSAESYGHIGGYSISQIISYYVFGTILSSFVFWSPTRTIKEEIINGEISTKYLTKPASHYWQFFFSDLAWHTVSPVLGLISLGLAMFFFRNFIQIDMDLVRLSLTLFAIGMGAVLCFNISYFFGLLAFYFTEVNSIYSVFWMGITLFGGTAIPVDFYPKIMKQIVYLLPFRYIFSFPLEIFLSRLTLAAAIPYFLVDLIWILLFALVCKILWNKGLKIYSAYGY